MNYEVELQGRSVVLTIAGRLDSLAVEASEWEELRAELERLAVQRIGSRAFVDLRHVEYADSRALHYLLAALDVVRLCAEVVFVGPGEGVARLQALGEGPALDPMVEQAPWEPPGAEPVGPVGSASHTPLDDPEPAIERDIRAWLERMRPDDSAERGAHEPEPESAPLEETQLIPRHALTLVDGDATPPVAAPAVAGSEHPDPENGTGQVCTADPGEALEATAGAAPESILEESFEIDLDDERLYLESGCDGRDGSPPEPVPLLFGESWKPVLPPEPDPSSAQERSPDAVVPDTIPADTIPARQRSREGPRADGPHRSAAPPPPETLIDSCAGEATPTPCAPHGFDGAGVVERRRGDGPTPPGAPVESTVSPRVEDAPEDGRSPRSGGRSATAAPAPREDSPRAAAASEVPSRDGESRGVVPADAPPGDWTHGLGAVVEALGRSRRTAQALRRELNEERARCEDLTRRLQELEGRLRAAEAADRARRAAERGDRLPRGQTLRLEWLPAPVDGDREGVVLRRAFRDLLRRLGSGQRVSPETVRELAALAAGAAGRLVPRVPALIAEPPADPVAEAWHAFLVAVSTLCREGVEGEELASVLRDLVLCALLECRPGRSAGGGPPRTLEELRPRLARLRCQGGASPTGPAAPGGGRGELLGDAAALWVAVRRIARGTLAGAGWPRAIHGALRSGSDGDPGSELEAHAPPLPREVYEAIDRVVEQHSFYLPGTWVELASGEIGAVLGPRPGHPEVPRVLVAFRRRGGRAEPAPWREFPSGPSDLFAVARVLEGPRLVETPSRATAGGATPREVTPGEVTAGQEVRPSGEGTAAR